MEFGVRQLAKGKDKDNEGYKVEILKIGGLILVPHIYNLFNLVVKHDILKSWTQRLILAIFKSGDKTNPSNHRITIIKPSLSKLYGVILENKINVWLEIHGKRVKG